MPMIYALEDILILEAFTKLYFFCTRVSLIEPFTELGDSNSGSSRKLGGSSDIMVTTSCASIIIINATTITVIIIVIIMVNWS